LQSNGIENLIRSFEENTKNLELLKIRLMGNEIGEEGGVMLGKFI